MVVGKVVDGYVWVCCMSWSTPARVWGYCGWVMGVMGVVLGIFGTARGLCKRLSGLSVPNPLQVR